jgi:8-oxo-dGTP pyrophosphatase MutT (NUDIX family)
MPPPEPAPGAEAVEVRAAGGLVWRSGPSRDVEVVVVHRPAYDDWSFPKGKLEVGETEEQAAIREVEEETGLRCRLERELGTTTHHDGRNRLKTVRYWLMTPVGGELAAANEVDRATWVTREAAMEVLSYERERRLLAALRPAESTSVGAERVDSPGSSE